MTQSHSRLFGLFALVAIFVSGCFLFGSQSPDEVLNKMHEKLNDNKSLSLNGSINGSFYAEDGMQNSFDVVVSGSVENPSAASASADLVAQLTTSGDAGEPFMLGFMLKLIDSKDVYFKIDAEKSPELAFAGDDWYRLPSEDDFEAMFGAEVSAETTGTELTDEQRKQIEQITKETQLLTLVEDKGTEEVQGVATYHYVVTIDTDALRTVIQRTNEVAPNHISEEEIDTLVELLADARAEIWIGKRDYNVYKLLVNEFEITDPENQNDVVMTFSMEFTFSDHGKEVTVTPPAFAKSIFELFLPLMMSGFGEAFLPMEAGEPVDVMAPQINSQFPSDFPSQLTPEEQAEINALLEAYQ